MEYYTVEEATEKIYTKLTDSTGWKFLKSQRSLKKTFKDLNFEIFHERINYFTKTFSSVNDYILSTNCL